MIEILQYDFMQRALIAGIIIAVVAPVIGMFLVVRRYSLLADTLAHVSLVGIVVGAITGINPVLSAIVTSVIASFFMEKLRSAQYIFGESILAIFLTGSLALASVLLVFTRGLSGSFTSFLFGSISTVTSGDVWVIAIASAVVLAMIVVLYKKLFLISLDEEIAQSSGIHTKFYNQLLIIIAAVTVAVTMRIIGVLLVGALMVIPVITAMQFGKSFSKTLLIAVLFSLTYVLSGIVLSFYLGTPSGGTIVLIAIGAFLLSLGLKKN